MDKWQYDEPSNATIYCSYHKPKQNCTSSPKPHEIERSTCTLTSKGSIRLSTMASTFNFSAENNRSDNERLHVGPS